MEYLFIWVIVGLGVGAVAGIVARAVCRSRRMYQLGERAFWVSLVCGPLGFSAVTALVFSIVAFTRDRDVGFTPAVGYVSCAAPVYRSVPTVGVSPAGGVMRIQCVAGPRCGQVYSLSRGVTTFGTDPRNSVHLPEGPPGVSRRHCCIRWQNSAPHLVDLNSSYGTYTNGGVRIPPQYPTELQPGSTFYLGSVNCLFRLTMD